MIIFSLGLRVANDRHIGRKKNSQPLTRAASRAPLPGIGRWHRRQVLFWGHFELVCVCVFGRQSFRLACFSACEMPSSQSALCCGIAASACKWHPSYFSVFFSPRYRYVTTDQTATVWCSSDAWNLWPTPLSHTLPRLLSRTRQPEPSLPPHIFLRTTNTRPYTTSPFIMSSSTVTRPWTRTPTRSIRYITPSNTTNSSTTASRQTSSTFTTLGRSSLRAWTSNGGSWGVWTLTGDMTSPWWATALSMACTPSRDYYPEPGWGSRLPGPRIYRYHQCDPTV